jgi:hypothetical protein
MFKIPPNVEQKPIKFITEFFVCVVSISAQVLGLTRGSKPESSQGDQTWKDAL